MLNTVEDEVELPDDARSDLSENVSSEVCFLVTNQAVDSAAQRAITRGGRWRRTQRRVGPALADDAADAPAQPAAKEDKDGDATMEQAAGDKTGEDSEFHDCVEGQEQTQQTDSTGIAKREITGGSAEGPETPTAHQTGEPTPSGPLGSKGSGGKVLVKREVQQEVGPNVGDMSEAQLVTHFQQVMSRTLNEAGIIMPIQAEVSDESLSVTGFGSVTAIEDASADVYDENLRAATDKPKPKAMSRDNAEAKARKNKMDEALDALGRKATAAIMSVFGAGLRDSQKASEFADKMLGLIREMKAEVKIAPLRFAGPPIDDDMGTTPADRRSATSEGLDAAARAASEAMGGGAASSSSGGQSGGRPASSSGVGSSGTAEQRQPGQIVQTSVVAILEFGECQKGDVISLARSRDRIREHLVGTGVDEQLANDTTFSTVTGMVKIFCPNDRLDRIFFQNVKDVSVSVDKRDGTVIEVACRDVE